MSVVCLTLIFSIQRKPKKVRFNPGKRGKKNKKQNRAISRTPDSDSSTIRPSHLPVVNDTNHIIYMTYFRLQASSRLCLAFQLAADLRVLVLSTGHVRVEVSARSDKGFLALSLLRLKIANNI